ncbi:hypothetical protein Nepgr_004713 [Nepenthes gracilis]|uniref:BHLH domain-containing protein n=1 Tax=Nepenthes gracilis TaxID=150966 RepID=A0AAD3S257_NEPGR|nr:hypothetical protein Nepgr_004713 [Nepenthes gracilis]
MTTGKERGVVLGGQETFLWESQSWAFSNSDNSYGGDEKSDTKIPDRDSDNPIGKDTDTGNKRGRSGGSKNVKEDGEGNDGKATGESDHEIHIWTERERRKKMRNMFSNLHALLPQLPPKADKSTIVDEAVNYIKTLQHTLQRLQKQKLERLQVARTVATVNCEPSSMTMMPSRLAAAARAPDTTREAFLADQGSSSSTCNFALPTASSSPGFSLPQLPVVFQTWTSSNVVLNVCGHDAQITVCSAKKTGLFTTICLVLDKYKIEVVSIHISSDGSRSIYMIQAHLQASGTNSDQFSERISVEEVYKQAAGEIMLWVSS